MPTPAAPVITSIDPNSDNSGLRVSYTYDVANTTRIAAEVDLFNDVGSPFTHSVLGQGYRFIRRWGDPPVYRNDFTPSTALLVDFEAPRDTVVLYRLRAWNLNSGIWTPSAYSTVVSGSLPVLRQAWLKDPYASVDLSGITGLDSQSRTLKTVIEGSELKYPGEAPAEVHFALGRADPILISDEVMYQSPQVPPGIFSHFPLIQVPFFVHSESELYTIRNLLANPVRPVLVQTGFGDATYIANTNDLSQAHQFYGQMTRSEVTAITTGKHQPEVVLNVSGPPGGPVPPGSHALYRTANLYRLTVDFQTVRRPPDPLV